MSAEPNDMWRVIQRQQMFQKPFQSTNSKPPDCTRIVCISDTHGRHRSFSLLPPGDILIHAGDFTLRGELAILQDISDYFGKLSESFSEIIVIAGNHDKILHREYYLSRAKGPTAEEEVEEALQVIRKNCVYLHDASYKTSSGLQVYGAQGRLGLYAGPRRHWRKVEKYPFCDRYSDHSWSTTWERRLC